MAKKSNFVPNLKGEGHSRKRNGFVIINKKFILSYSPKIEPLKYILYLEIGLQKIPKSDIDSHHFETSP